MPAYDYVCEDCGARFEVRMSMAAYAGGARPACEACGSTRVARALTAVSVLTGGRGGSSGASCGNPGCGSGRFT
ncbi:MAG TPA: zinc ribbon domain-containing protein [Gemmatimonadales bacterium]|nr:zinc ribbon domain-containing protein [Gemmatimonadales bacterium]